MLPEPLRSYAVKILGDVWDPKSPKDVKSPEEVAHALRIYKPRVIGRRKGTDKYQQELVDWYMESKKQGIEPNVENCTVPCENEQTIRRFLKGDLRKECDFMLELNAHGILPDPPTR